MGLFCEGFFKIRFFFTYIVLHLLTLLRDTQEFVLFFFTFFCTR